MKYSDHPSGSLSESESESLLGRSSSLSSGKKGSSAKPSWGIGLMMNGKVIVNLIRDSPAHLAGLVVGDEIVEVNGKEVTVSSNVNLEGDYESQIKLTALRMLGDEGSNKLVFNMKRTLSLTRKWYVKDFLV